MSDTKPSEAAREYAKNQEPLEPPGSGWGFTDEQIETAFDAGDAHGVKRERERILSELPRIEKLVQEARAARPGLQIESIAVREIKAIIEGGECKS